MVLKGASVKGKQCRQTYTWALQLGKMHLARGQWKRLESTSIQKHDAFLPSAVKNNNDNYLVLVLGEYY